MTQTARLCQDVGPLVKKSDLTPWQAMCLHLLYERARGETSFWYPYIAVLPKELELIGIHPMLWSQVRTCPHPFGAIHEIALSTNGDVLNICRCEALMKSWFWAENEAGVAGGLPHVGRHREEAGHLQVLAFHLKKTSIYLFSLLWRFDEV